jgi:DNA-binding beta-propeller fold protein YncE
VGTVLSFACFDDPTHGLDGSGLDGEDPYGEDQLGGTDLGTTAPELPGVALEGFKSPLRAAAVPGGLLVTDPSLRMVLQLDATTLTLGQGIYIDGQPLGVGYWDHFIFVGNATKRTIEVFDGRGGGFLSDFGHGAVGHPSDIAVDQEEARLFVVDGAAKTVEVFNPSGTRLLTISGPGRGEDRLANPIGVAVDVVRKEVLVSDYGSLGPSGYASVKIFGYDGEFRAEISGAGVCGSAGCSDGFSRPQGVAVGQDGRVYVADALLGKVLAFDRSTLARAGEIGDRDFTRMPTDLAVGVAGDLFVVAYRSRVVRVVRRATAP